MQLSKNFTLEEFTKSDTATKKGIDNTPQGVHMDNLKNLVEKIVQPVRDHYSKPVKVNSGYRGPKLNEAVGGSATSQHCNGEACDIEIPGVPNADLANWIKDNLEFDQLILEFYTPGVPDSGWVHVSLKKSGPQRKQCLTAMKENGKTVYKTGLIA